MVKKIILAIISAGIVASPLSGICASRERFPQGLEDRISEEIIITDKEVKEVLKGEPPMNELFQEALNYAGLNPQVIHKWNRDVKKAPLLPKFEIGFKRGLNDKITVNVDDNVSVSSGGTVIGPQSSSWDRYSNNDTVFDVKAVWELDQLIFRKEALNISAEARNLSLDRHEILDRINFTYHERVKWLAFLINPQGKALVDNGLLRIYLDELAATLDALTGGWYSRWKKERNL